VRVRWLTAFLDVPHPDLVRTVDFWSAVTGYRLSAWREERFATLLPPTGTAQLRVQDVGDSPARLHLDLHVTDPEDLAEQAIRLGATDVTAGSVPNLRSPAGLVFCPVSDLGPARLPAATSWPATAGRPAGHSLVDQVCLDIPPSRYRDEVAFWRDLTGWRFTDNDAPEFQRLDGDGTMRILLQRLDDEPPGSAAGAHLDLSCDDRWIEAQRHRELGAAHCYDGRGWITLADPAGRRYCITGRHVPLPSPDDA
jgi:hypothetical protein